MRIFLSAGEPSGDLHAANLLESLRKRMPDAEFVGFGGPRMEAAGARLLYPLVELSVMWFLRVLLNIHVFFRLLKQAEDYFRDEKPDVLIMVDYPGFHWVLARRAKRQGIPVVYYVPPQIWAWGGWRVEKMRKYVDLVLCSLPFEPDWYHARGVTGAEYIGHPYFDELADRILDADFLAKESDQDGPLVAILPGSRTQEMTRNLPEMVKAAVEVALHRPDARFAVACLHERHQALAREILEEADLAGLNIQVYAGKTPEILRIADCCWSVSGSVGLELMAEALPSVVLYKVNRIDLWIARPFIQTRFISLVNLLAGAELMPEFLTHRDVSSELARRALTWILHPSERAKASTALANLRDRVAIPGASDRAAERILGYLGDRSPLYRGPHAAVEARTRADRQAAGTS